MTTIKEFYARYGLAPHRQKEARDSLGITLKSARVDGRRQKVYSTPKQIDQVLWHFNMIRIPESGGETVAKVIRKNKI